MVTFEFISQFNDFLSLATVVSQITILVMVVSFFIKKRFTFIEKMSQYGLHIAFFFALAAMAGSLTYSEIIGYLPCTLCWYQRICMYPQVLLLGIAVVKKDMGVLRYSVPLAGVGAVIALYHYQSQFTKLTSSICGSDALGSCTDRFLLELGYITIPVMALTAFAGILVFLFAYKRYHKNLV